MADLPVSPPEIGSAPTYPNRETVAPGGELVYIQETATADQRLVPWTAEFNAAASNVYDNSVKTFDNAVIAENAAAVSAGNANYAGLWSTQSGAASPPLAVGYPDVNPQSWILAAPVADITATIPGVGNSDWISGGTVLNDTSTTSTTEAASVNRIFELFDKATLTQTFSNGQEAQLNLSQAQLNALVTVQKEVVDTGVINSDWKVAVNEGNFDFEDFAPATSVTPSATTGDITLTLGAGSFQSSDVGKIVKGNGGKAILTSVSGDATVVSDFINTSIIASGSWTMNGAFSSGSQLSNGFLSVPYKLSLAQYNGDTFDSSSEAPSSREAIFSDDGSILYVLRSTGDLYQYTPSTPGVLAGAVFTTKVFSFSGQDSAPFCIRVNSSGTKMYMIGNNGSIYQYSMTGGQVDTLSYDSLSFATGFSAPSFYLSGLDLYIANNTAKSIDQYQLSDPADISTASVNGTAKSVSTEEGNLLAVWFSSDKSVMMIGGNASDSIHSYTLLTPGTVSTASLDYTFSVISEALDLFGISTDSSGGKIYAHSSTSDTFTYDLSVVATGSFPCVTKNSINTDVWTDINSMTATDSAGVNELIYAVSTDDRSSYEVYLAGSGSRLIARDNGGTWEYNSNATYSLETWTAASENTEFGALIESVTVVANKMDSTQLNAATDVDFSTTTSTIDLSIIFVVTSGESTTDGVDINYDANAQWVQAVNGTEYEARQPDDSTVYVKSLISGSNNLRVRVL